MTKEEKAKAYDKVREKIALRFGPKVAEEIFSVLEESEDEKFMKYILKCCEETISADDRGLELSMATTIKLKNWLEKQGKQILANSAQTCKIENYQEEGWYSSGDDDYICGISFDEPIKLPVEFYYKKKEAGK